MKSPLLMTFFRRGLVLALAACTLAAANPSAAAMTVDTLRCEYKNTPLGVDSSQPRLSWVPESQQRGDTVTAYQVWVASSAAALASGGDLWDSGEVTSSNNEVSYGGTALSSAQQVFWQVRVWNGAGAVSNWSAPASWTMGVLTPSAWTGQWITAPRAASGYHDNGSNTATGVTKWVQVDLGSAQSITTVRLDPTNNPNLNLPAYGFPVRFEIQMSNDPTFASGVTTVTNQTAADYANPGATAVAFPASGSARYVRVTATTLFYAPNNNIVGSNYVFSLSQIEVVAGGQNVALGKSVSSADSLEHNSEWAQASLTDGLGMVGSQAVTQSDRFRTNFTVASGLQRATVFVCGLGQYEMTLNGAKVGADVMTPNWSNYNKTCYYDTYDVTSMLQTGANAAGIALGNGFYNVNGGRYTKVTCSFGPRRVIAQIRLQYSNGTVTTIGTDPTWRWSPGPATFSCIYGGEDVDGRLDAAGWDTASFNSSTWLAPLATTGPTGGTLRGSSLNAAPTHVTQTFTPASSTVIGTNSTVYDFGQNASQIPIITVHGTAGSTVKLTMAEYVNSNGTLAPIVSPVSMTYTLKGSGSETFAPKFFYMGYRFMEADLRDPSGNASGSLVPTLDSITSQAITCSPGTAGTFSTSSTLFNDISTLVYWAQVNDLTNGVLTDCPTREKLGWQEVSHLNGPALRYQNDLLAQYNKQCNDFIDGQQSNGMIPSVLPAFGTSGDVSPEWGTSAVMVPWQQYQFAGDVTVLSRNYASAKAFVNYLTSQSSGYLLNYGLGDWYDLGPNGVGASQDTPQGLTATAIYYQDSSVLSQWAQVLGNTADASTYSQLASNIRTAFNSQFLNPSTQTYGVGTFTSGPSTYGSQTSNAMPLALGMVDPANQAAVLNAIVNDLAGRGYVVTSGDVGYRYLIRALADNGRSDVLFDTDDRTNDPGYGYILSTGATSMTEAWDASPADSHSLDHCMLGQVMEWFYHDLAGIQSDPTGPGFQKIIIKPSIVGDLTNVSATYNSVRGAISSTWSVSGSQLGLNVTIPPGTTASVYLPLLATNTAGLNISESGTAIMQNGTATGSDAGVSFLGFSSGSSLYQSCAGWSVGSGTYQFTWQFSPAPPTGPTASAVSGQDTLSWTDVPGASGYNVKRATVSGGPYQTIASGITSTSYVDTGLQNGTTYYYVVSAIVNGVETGNSAEVQATPSPNFGFEFPVISTYQYNPSGAAWTFNALNGTSGSGISGNGSGFTGSNANAPQGNQVAFLQGTAAISQTIYNLLPGASYLLTFSGAQRVSTNVNGQTWNVTLDGNVIGTYAPAQSATAYVDYTATFMATKTAHTLSFVGTDTRGGDNTIFLDNVRLTAVTNKLSGTIIGTPGSWGNSGNTIAMVFDGNLTTFFDSPTSTGWAGLDFGTTPAVITQVQFCPRPTYASRMVGGIFQGANSADFSDGVTLFTVASAPTQGVMTAQAISSSTPYRYVRYLGPANSYGNVAELEFDGLPALPLTPAGLSATAGFQQVSLAWSSAAGAAAYQIQRSIGGAAFATMSAAPATPGYVDTGLSDGTQYSYRVFATNSTGSSTNSNTASATPTAPPITAQEEAPPVLVVSGLSGANGSASCTVPVSVVGHTYQLQYVDNLASGAWQAVPGVAAQAGTGAALQFTAPVVTSVPQRFYRILITLQ